jgi:SAM-dependent methyltransferase
VRWCQATREPEGGQKIGLKTESLYQLKKARSMGIDVHGLNLLRYSRHFRDFGSTITIGRQGLDVIESDVRYAVAAHSDYRNDRYCEPLLIRYFGSTTVDSIDNSDYEGASLVHDMNLPVPSNLHARYDTVIDGGCLEHIYNVPQALKNCSLLCKPGGQILHVLPANNFCGHGFWQFSPELFFSLYSNPNGYRDTDVFLADLSDTSKWFKVKTPQNGQRVTVHSSTELYVLVRTALTERPFSQSNIQQSDYVFGWSNESPPSSSPKPNKIKHLLRDSPVYGVVSPFYHLLLRLRPKASTSKLNGLNPGLAEVDVRSFF